MDTVYQQPVGNRQNSLINLYRVLHPDITCTCLINDYSKWNYDPLSYEDVLFSL